VIKVSDKKSNSLWEHRSVPTAMLFLPRDLFLLHQKSSREAAGNAVTCTSISCGWMITVSDY
jgi:hypothetical protein